MKTFFIILVSFLFFSCSNRQNDTTELHQRIKRLEERMDSLSDKPNSSSNSSNKLGSFIQGANCLAKTKKGLQCKRKAKSNGYCWQHGK